MQHHLLAVVFLLCTRLSPSVSAAAKKPPPAAPPPPPDVSPYTLQWFLGAPFGEPSFIGEGDTLTWVWFDSLPHSLEGDDPASTAVFTGPGTGADVIAQKGYTKSITFLKSGTYNYKCHTHPYIMTGTVYVKAKYNFGGVELKWFLGITLGGASAIIREGDTVSWRWSDDLPHALTAQNGDTTMFGEGPGRNNQTVSGEDTFVLKQKFTKAGVYLYKCQNHGLQMQGNITVLPKNAKVPPSGSPTPSPSPPPPAPPSSAPPLPCKKTCNGKCWGSDGCGGTCQYPVTSKNRPADCKKCCTAVRPKKTPAKTINACYAFCTKAK